MNRLISGMVVATLVCPMAVAQSPPAPAPDAANPVFTQPQDLKWRVYPGGTKAAILHIDPTTRTTELMIWNPPNTHVPRHWHSANEKISMISGTFIMKHDDGGDPVALNAGAFAYMPAKMIHEAWTKPDTDALYFITVDGAWDYNEVEPPTKATQ
jgi:quercetin dioxygenase-like cupin family protein